jgi:hypothetical protein
MNVIVDSFQQKVIRSPFDKLRANGKKPKKYSTLGVIVNKIDFESVILNSLRLGVLARVGFILSCFDIINVNDKARGFE